jgi:DNA-binding NarL/FixJ family response regulator
MSSEGKRGWVKTEQGERPTDQRMLEIVFQIEAGREYKAIAEQFQISRVRISRIARRLGLADRRFGRRTKKNNNFHTASAT